MPRSAINQTTFSKWKAKHRPDVLGQAARHS